MLDTRKLDDGDTIRRRRRCPACGRRFTTYERYELMGMTVVKKHGEREPYNREKLMRGIRTACYRRPVSQAHLDRLVSEVEATLAGLDEREVASRTIGDLIMARLRDLDEVAYIRFASVYRAFHDLGTLREAVEALMDADPPPTA